jgi:hypothetical protein
MHAQYLRTSESDYVEDPIAALGNMLRANIIGYVRRHGPSRRGEIAATLDVGYPAVAKLCASSWTQASLRHSPRSPSRTGRLVHGQPRRGL